MSSYQLTTTARLAREVERAKGILLVHMQPGKAYTAEELLTMLADYGLHYSNPEYLEIGKVLISQGVIEQV